MFNCKFNEYLCAQTSGPDENFCSFQSFLSFAYNIYFRGPKRVVIDVHECDIDDAHKCVFAVIALLLAAIIYPVQFSKDMENGKITFQLVFSTVDTR